MAKEVVKIGRSRALALFTHCEWGSAGKWTNERMGVKLLSIPEILTDATENPEDPEVKATLIEVMAGIEDGVEFEVFDDADVAVEKVAEKEEEKPAKTKAKSKAKEPEPEDEPEDDAEPEDESDGETEPEDVEPGVVDQSKTTVEVIDGLTADRVDEILGADNVNNLANRKFGAGLSRRYKLLMLTGGWDFGLRVHVIIDTNGQVHNSQHVLFALKSAEAERKKHPEKYPLVKGPLKLDVIVERGISPRSANFIDIGKPRNHTDIVYRNHPFDAEFKISEQAVLAKWTATAAKIIFNRVECGKKVRSSGRFEHSELVGVLEANPGLISSAQFIFDLNKTENHEGCITALGVSPAYLVAAHHLASFSETKNGVSLRDDEADEFFTSLAFGGELKETDPVYVLREWLLRTGKTSRGNEALNRVYDALVVAFNATMEGEEISGKQLSSIKSTAFPVMGGLDTLPVIEKPEPKKAKKKKEKPADGEAPKGKRGRPKKAVVATEE